MKISIAVDIDSSPEKVFFWLKHPERAKEWMTSVSETEMLSGTSNTVGATFREVIEDANGQTEMQGVVTGYRENESISFHLSGQYNTVDVEFRLEKIGERTRVIQSAEVRFRSFMKILSIFLGSKFKKGITAQSQREFARLKELCESKEYKRVAFSGVPNSRKNHGILPKAVSPRQAFGSNGDTGTMCAQCRQNDIMLLILGTP